MAFNARLGSNVVLGFECQKGSLPNLREVSARVIRRDFKRKAKNT